MVIVGIWLSWTQMTNPDKGLPGCLSGIDKLKMPQLVLSSFRVQTYVSLRHCRLQPWYIQPRHLWGCLVHEDNVICHSMGGASSVMALRQRVTGISSCHSRYPLQPIAVTDPDAHAHTSCVAVFLHMVLLLPSSIVPGSSMLAFCIVTTDVVHALGSFSCLLKSLLYVCNDSCTPGGRIPYVPCRVIVYCTMLAMLQGREFPINQSNPSNHQPLKTKHFQYKKDRKSVV